MTKVLGLLMVLGGLALGLYVGLWFMFVGGIISIVNGGTADPGNAGNIAWGIVRIVFSSVVGEVVAWILIIPGAALIVKD